MSKKVYLSPSNQDGNKCLKGDSERDHCNELTDYIVKYLELNGIEYKRAGLTETLESRVKSSNSYKPDIHYCIHTNAGGGSRSVLYGYNKTASKWAKLAEYIKKCRATIYPREIRLAAKPSFYEIKNTVAMCMYDEVMFHDDKSDSEFFHNNIDAIAREIVRGICEYFEIDFIESNGYSVEDALQDIKAIIERVNI